MTPFQAQIDINEPNRQLLAKLQKDYESRRGKIKTQPLIQRNKAAYFIGPNGNTSEHYEALK